VDALTGELKKRCENLEEDRYIKMNGNNEDLHWISEKEMMDLKRKRAECIRAKQKEIQNGGPKLIPEEEDDNDNVNVLSKFFGNRNKNKNRNDNHDWTPFEFELLTNGNYNLSTETILKFAPKEIKESVIKKYKEEKSTTFAKSVVSQSLIDLEKERNCFESELQVKKAQVVEKDKEIEGHAKKLGAKDKEIEGLVSAHAKKLGAKDKEIKDHKTILGEKEEKIGSAESSITEYQKKITEIKNELTEKNSLNSELNKNVKDYGEKLKAKDDDISLYGWVIGIETGIFFIILGLGYYFLIYKKRKQNVKEENTFEIGEPNVNENEIVEIRESPEEE